MPLAGFDEGEQAQVLSAGLAGSIRPEANKIALENIFGPLQ
jgi:hypothetical protein